MHRRKKRALKTVYFIIFISLVLISSRFVVSAIELSFNEKKAPAEAAAIASADSGNEEQKLPVEREQDMDAAKKVRDMLKEKDTICQDKKQVYLTFDDGPSVTNTPKILGILKNENVKATFFVVGNQIDSSEKSKEILRQTVNEGHSVGIHTYTHDYKILYPRGRVSKDAFLREVERTNESINNALGRAKEIKLVRFPGGHCSWNGTKDIDQVLDEKGYVYIDWNCLIGDSEDPKGRKKSKDELIKRFEETKKEYEKNGTLVILMHDTYGKETTSEALPYIIEQLKNQQYEFCIF